MLRLVALAALVTALPPYRLTAQQCPDGSPPPCDRNLRRPAPANSVGVLYFDNQSRDSADAYLADALTDDIITRLGRLPQLDVASRYLSRRYRSAPSEDAGVMGRAMDVAHLLSGGLRHERGRLIVTVELVTVVGARRVWGDQFDRPDSDLAGVAVDIAEQVATAIAGRLASSQRTSVAARLTAVPQAYEYFFRGNALIAARSARATDRAIHEYEIATRFDPGFTSALARIAYCYGILLTWGWDPRGLSRDSLLNLGLAAADRALRRDSMSSDVWMARGYLLSARNPRTFEGVREVFQRALALNPRNAEAHHQYGSALRLMGRDAESAAMLERALAIEPGRPVTHFVRAELDMVAGRLPAARAWLDSAVLSDARMYFALAQRARIRAMVGDSAGARSDAETAIVVSQAEDSLWGNAAMAVVEAQAGDTASARARLDRLVRAFASRGTEPHAAWMIASGYLALHDSGRALDILESATPRGGRIWFYMRMPEFDAIRGQSRFVQLVADSRPSGTP